MIGGAGRVPKVQELIQEYLSGSELEISTHLNGDEAMTKGAGFFAANFSSSFRVRPVLLTDGLNVPVKLTIMTMNDIESEVEGEVSTYKKEVELFPVKTKFGTKKSFSFKKDKNLELLFTYGDDDLLYKTVHVKNIAEVAQVIL
jgi:molecular chaperone DnaK (HSP70)